ncbi:MAG: choice-of-anchor D domain-containing protein [Deltaproteobacteria bacterium]|nr:choice-of-anchor D domain-containing protein [Deltaproteobacteria bacterium]
MQLSRTTSMLFRSALALTLLGTTVTTACNRTEISALRARFDITWAEDFGFVAGDLDASGFVFGTVTTGEVSTIEVAITNGGNATLDVLSLDIVSATFDENGDLANEMVVENHPELTHSGIPGAVPNGSLYTFEMRFSPIFGTALDEGLFLAVSHELNEDGPKLYVPITGEGFGEPQPDIYSKPEWHDFGTIDLGQTSPEVSFAVGNGGPGQLEIGSVSLDDTTNFTLVDASAIENVSFANGDVGMITVVFHPQDQGEVTGTIVINSNDPDEDPYSIQLQGIGDPAELGDPPTAVCQATFDGNTGQAVQGLHACTNGNCPTAYFDGTGSTDPSGQALSYQWTLTGASGSSSSLSSTTAANPSLLLDVAGTYSVELVVTNADNQSSPPCTATVEAIPNENFRVELSWANSGDDMDLHLLQAQPAGSPRSDGDCYYANCQGTWGALDWGFAGVTDDDPNLDLDDISGVGPENINIVQPAGAPYDGWYEIFVHDYPGSSYTPSNAVTVNIFLNGVLAQTYNFAISGEDSDYYVAKIQWPTGQIIACNGLAGCP